MRQPGRGDYPARPLGNLHVEQVGDDVELAFDKGQIRNIEMLTMADTLKLLDLLQGVVRSQMERLPEVRIVFDGPPGPITPGLVEVEDADGHSINVGEWFKRQDGYVELRLKAVVDA